MAGKLSKVQKRAYNKLKRSGGWRSSYELGESMATMGALRDRGLVKSGGGSHPGSFSSPQTGIKWKVIS